MAAAGPFDVVHAHDFNTLNSLRSTPLCGRPRLSTTAMSCGSTGRCRGGRRRCGGCVGGGTRWRWLVRRGWSSRCQRRDRARGCGRADCRMCGSYGTRSRVRTDVPAAPSAARAVCCTPDASEPGGICRPWSRRLVSWRRSGRLLMGSVDPELPLGSGAGGERRGDVDRRGRRTLRSYGISLVTLTNTCENHRLALPNKLFHAVRAGVPVVAADLPELRAVVTQYNLGGLVRARQRPLAGHRGPHGDRGLRRLHRRSTGCRRQELNWEHDAELLVAAYADLRQ